MKFVTPVVLALVLGASGAIAAEEMYRSTMPDGSVRYGESPEPGAKSVRKVPPPPPATGVTVVTPEEKGRQFPVEKGGATVLPQQEQPARQQFGGQGNLQSGRDTMPRRGY